MGELNRHAAAGALNDRIESARSGDAEWLRRTKSNNSFDRSGISMAFIVNLDVIRGYFPPGQFGR